MTAALRVTAAVISAAMIGGAMVGCSRIQDHQVEQPAAVSTSTPTPVATTDGSTLSSIQGDLNAADSSTANADGDVAAADASSATNDNN